MAQDQRKRISHAQNFLIRSSLAQRIIEQSGIEPADLVIEIGAGRGTLTRGLAASCRQVIAIEKDPTLARRLGREVRSLGNVAVFEGDFLTLPLPVTPYKVVANIPFNITAAIVTKLTRTVIAPDSASLVIQREAAERFTGQPKQTLASLMIGPWFDRSVSLRFRRQDFVPPPRVDVVLLRFSKRGPPLLGPDEAQAYRDFVTYGFTAWKPTIAEAYGSVLPARTITHLASESGIDPGRKPSEVSLEAWIAFFRAFRRCVSSDRWQIFAGAEDRLRDQQAGIEKRRTRTG